MNACPGLRPRWKPEHSPYRAQVCCLPPDEKRRLSPLVAQRVIPVTTTIHFSELNTQPASLIHPASDSLHRVGPRISLLIWWLTFNQVGLGPLLILTHWVTISNFIPPRGNPNDLSLSRHDHPPGYILPYFDFFDQLREYHLKANCPIFSYLPISRKK